MRRISIALLLTAIALLLAASIPASAQSGASMGTMGPMKMWNVRAGLFFPTGDTVDNSEFFIGIEHVHPADQIIKGVPGDFTLTIDWTRITTTEPGGGTDDATLVPIIFNWRQTQMLANGRDWYYSVGLGVYWAMDDIPDMRLDKGTKFAYQGMIGYHFNPSWFVEGRYLADGHPGDDGLFGLDIGYTF